MDDAIITMLTSIWIPEFHIKTEFLEGHSHGSNPAPTRNPVVFN